MSKHYNIVLRLTKEEALSLCHAAMVGQVHLEPRLDGRSEIGVGAAERYLTEERIQKARDVLTDAVGKHWPRTGLP